MFKKPKLKFECLLPEVAEQMPIVPAGKIQYQWAKKMIKNMREESIKCPMNAQHTHIAKCPGIALVARQGWVQKSYQDIYIKTDANGGFEWNTPLDQTQLTVDHEWNFPYITYHPSTDTEPYGILKPNTMSTVIKINSPWVVTVPKGYYLLCMPIPYHDDNRFTASIGLIDGDAGINFLNVQLFWHVSNSEEVIPAGTPLAQYYLIKKENIDTEIGPYTSSTLKGLRKRRLSLDSMFNRKYINLKKEEE